MYIRKFSRSLEYKENHKTREERNEAMRVVFIAEMTSL